jgi:hypothetical protein
MAIAKAVTKFGVALNNAYHRIEWLNLNLLHGNPTLEVVVASYTQQNGELIERRNFVLPSTDKASVSLRYAYTELAKLSEFAGGAEV